VFLHEKVRSHPVVTTTPIAEAATGPSAGLFPRKLDDRPAGHW